MVPHFLQRHAGRFRNKKLMAIPQDDFASIVHEHEAMLYRIAFNFFLSVHAAEEIVQDVFLQCFKNLKRIESPNT